MNRERCITSNCKGNYLELMIDLPDYMVSDLHEF